MRQELEKFLEFNGRTLVFLAVDGTYWIAVKPICEALNVNYNRQFQNLQADPLFGPVFAKQQMQIPGDQSRIMVCLPERYIYGWLLAIRSESEELLNYRKACYDILYDYFHGTITRRKRLFEEKVKIQNERGRLEIELRSDTKFVRLEDLRAREARIGKELKEMDSDELNEQRELFND